MRSLIVCLFMAGVIVCLAACPSGHKNFGGSSLANMSNSADSAEASDIDTSGSETSAASYTDQSDQEPVASNDVDDPPSGDRRIPAEAGAYVNFGQGWVSMEPYRTGTSLIGYMAGLYDFGDVTHCRVPDLEEDCVDFSGGTIRLATRAIKGCEADSIAHLYKLTVKDDNFAYTNEAQQVRMREEVKGDLYTAEANVSEPGYYALAAINVLNSYTVHIRCN
jgi:hypothetical protein